MQPHQSLPWSSLPEHSDDERIARSRRFLEAVSTRRTCRYFSADPVPRAVIDNAIRAAGTAPSGANRQPWHFCVVESAGAKRAIREAAEKEEHAFYAGKAGAEWLEALAPLGTDENKAYLETAPYSIVVFGQRRGGLQPGDNKQNYYVTESVGIACGILLLALHDAGLATLTHTPNPMKFLNALCGRPETEKPVMVIVAGKAAPGATVPVHATIKKPLDQISSTI